VLYESAEFLSVHEYRHVARWTEQIAERPAVKRGRIVNNPGATRSSPSGTAPPTSPP
jgi:GST-like protein